MVAVSQIPTPIPFLRWLRTSLVVQSSEVMALPIAQQVVEYDLPFLGGASLPVRKHPLDLFSFSVMHV
jgi:hypothetical protein